MYMQSNEDDELGQHTTNYMQHHFPTAGGCMSSLPHVIEMLIYQTEIDTRVNVMSGNDGYD